MTKVHVDTIDLMMEQYNGEVAPLVLCPMPLFAAMIRINHVRMQAATQNAPWDENLSLQADDILRRITSFSPEEWSRSKASSQDSWELIGGAYQAAMILYCIWSLQSVSLIPRNTEQRSRCLHTRMALHSLLEKGLSLSPTNRVLLWPLVVLGVEAVYGETEVRSFVARELSDMSRRLGTFVPLTAVRTLETFWKSGGTDWDSCFDRPYAFTTQIAVDTKQFVQC